MPGKSGGYGAVGDPRLQYRVKEQLDIFQKAKGPFLPSPDTMIDMLRQEYPDYKNRKIPRKVVDKALGHASRQVSGEPSRKLPAQPRRVKASNFDRDATAGMQEPEDIANPPDKPNGGKAKPYNPMPGAPRPKAADDAGQAGNRALADGTSRRKRKASQLLRKGGKRRRKSGQNSKGGAEYSSSSSSDDDSDAEGGNQGDSGTSSFKEVLGASERPATRYSDLGGIEGVLYAVRELIEYPLTHPEVYAHIGVDPPRGVLLHGPPGCGKTLLAHAIAGELGVSFFRVSAPEITSGVVGAAEKKIRSIFESARQAAPSLVFIDEIDAIAPKLEAGSRGMERRVVAQLLTAIDRLGDPEPDAGEVGGVQEEKGAQATGSVQAGTPASGAGAGAAAMQDGDDAVDTATGIEPSTADAPRLRPAVVVLGATSKPENIDPGLRRSGRFDREVGLGIPDEKARAHILRRLTRGMKLSEEINVEDIARRSPGYVGADLAALTKEAAVCAVHRVFGKVVAGSGLGSAAAIKPPVASSLPGIAASGMSSALSASAAATSSSTSSSSSSSAAAGTTSSQRTEESFSKFERESKYLREMGPLGHGLLDELKVTISDFEEALKKVQPSATREGFATVPKVTWDDVGALQNIRDELRLSILEPIRNPEAYQDLGMLASAGLLLFGPPGCGKTLLAKAIANQSGANFISVKGPELLDKYVGESERAVRQVFSRANASAPCVVFFDEIDALAPRRGGSGSGNAVTDRVVNQLLTELDGMDVRRDVFIIAATNRPDIIDKAMLRPGRLDKLLYVPLPTASDRAAILETHTRKVPMGTDVDVHKLAHDPRCEGFSGADLAGLVRESAMESLRERLGMEPRAVAEKRMASAPRGVGTGAIAAPATAVASTSSSSGASTVDVPATPGGTKASVCARHFDAAFDKVRPSVSRADQRMYERIRASVHGLSGAKGKAARVAEAAAAVIKAQSKAGPGDSGSEASAGASGSAADKTGVSGSSAAPVGAGPMDAD